MKVRVTRTIRWSFETDESSYTDYPSENDAGNQMSYDQILKWEESLAVVDVLESLECAEEKDLKMTCEVEFINADKAQGA